MLRVQIEVAILRLEVARLAFLPHHQVQRRSWSTELRLALELLGRKSRPEIASIWLWGIADKARLATKGEIWLCCQCGIRANWLRANSNLKGGSINNCCDRGMPQLESMGRRRHKLAMINLQNLRISLLLTQYEVCTTYHISVVNHVSVVNSSDFELRCRENCTRQSAN